MSDDSGRGYTGDDPFVDAGDPDAVARAERRREREEKRASKRGKKGAKQPAPAPPPPAPPPAPPRTPEQEFWDEPAEPTPPATLQPPAPGQEPGDLPKPDPEKAKAGRRRLLGRRRNKAAAAGGVAAGVAAGEVGPPTAEAPLPKPAAPPSEGAPTTGEAQQPMSPPTVETPAANAPPTPPGESPTGEQPAAKAPVPPTEEAATIEPAGPPTAEQPMPRQPEQPDDQHPPTAAGPATAQNPRLDPGEETADAPRLDPRRGTARGAVPGDAADPSTREHRAPVPIPVDQTGAGDWEPPPPRDDDWFDTGEHGFHEDGDPTMAGAARSGRRHGEDDRKGGILGRIFRHPFLIVGAIILIFVLIILNGLFQPFHGDGHGKVAVVVPKGSSVGEVGDLLEKKGVISGGTLFISGSTMFQARVTLAGKRSDLFPGKYTMAKDMSYGDAISQLSKEASTTTASGVVTVTIPEGYTRIQAAQLAKEDGLRGSYMKATKKSKYLNPAQYGGKGAKNLEGFLFPDTWELKSHSPVANLVQLQLQDFKKKIKQVNMKYAKSKNLTIFDVLTIASIIEHEAGTAGQRKLVASVIYNRLREGMTLGSDATVRFATGNFEKPLTQSQLESNSPYNTRVHPGLPPGPISNPGLAAINAAAHPAKKNYLFFVTSPDCKTLNFSATEAEFEVDVQKYEASKCTE